MAEYTPPTTQPTGGRRPGKGLKPIKPLGPPTPLKPLVPVTTVPPVPGGQPKLKPLDGEEEGEWSLENVASALSPQKNADFLVNAMIAAGPAVIGLGAGLFQKGEGKLSTAGKITQALLAPGLGPVIKSKTGEEYTESVVGTFSGRNLRSAKDAVKRGDTPLPYLMEDAGNAAIFLGGAGAALKGTTAGGRITPRVAAAANRAGTTMSKAANIADWIGDAPIRLPVAATGKAIKTVGANRRAVATNLRREANALEISDPTNPEILAKRSRANRLDARYGKDIYREGAVKTVTKKMLNFTVNRAVRRATSNSTEIVQELIKVQDNPAFVEEMGALTPEENQAIFAVINGRAELIRNVAERLGETPQRIAYLGRLNFQPGYSLTEQGAALAVDYLNGNLDPRQTERIRQAAEVVSARLEKMSAQARAGYGRRSPLTPAYDIPFPEPERFAQAMAAAGRTDIAMEMADLAEQGFFDDLQAPEVIEYMRVQVENAPEQVALDSQIYPPKERNNVEFYKRLREAYLASAEATTAGSPRPGPDRPEGPQTGVPPQPFYDTNKNPGDLVRMPARNIQRSIKILEKLRGKTRRLAEQIVDAEIRVRKLEFVVIKAQFQIDQLRGYYTDADGNSVAAGSPDAVNYVPGMLEKLQAERDRLVALDEQMRATQSDSIVVDNVIVTQDLVQENIAVIDGGIEAVGAALDELEAKIDVAVDEMNAEEARQADAANQMEDAGENPDEILEAAAADVEDIEGDPTAFEDDAVTAATNELAAAQQAVTEAQVAKAQAQAEYEAAQTAVSDAQFAATEAGQEFRDAQPQPTRVEVPTQEAVVAPTQDQLLAVLNRLADEGRLPSSIAKRVEKAFNLKYVPPKKGTSRKNLDKAAFSSGTGALGDAARGLWISDVNGQRWWTNSYVAVVIDPESALGKKLAASGNEPGVYRTETKGRSRADLERAPMKNTGGGPNLASIVNNKDTKATAKAKPATAVASTILPNAEPGVILEAPDGTQSVVVQEYLDIVAEAGDTLHVSDPNKPVVIKRDGEVIGILMPQRVGADAGVPVGPELVYQKLQAGEFGKLGAAAAEIEALATQTPKLSKPGKAKKAPDLDKLSQAADEADQRYVDAQDAAEVATQKLREADGTLSAAESRLAVATAALQELPAPPVRLGAIPSTQVFEKSYGKGKNQFKIIGTSRPTDGGTLQAASFVSQQLPNGYTVNGWKIEAFPGATRIEIEDALRLIEQNVNSDFPSELGSNSGSVGQTAIGKRHGRVMYSSSVANTSKAKLASAQSAREAFNDFKAAFERGELDEKFGLQERAAAAPGPGLKPVAVQPVESVIAGTDLPEAKDPPAPLATGRMESAASESNWTKIDDNNWSINTGFRSYLATKVDIGITKSGKPRSKFVLKRYGSDGLPIESTAMEYPNFKQARQAVDEGLQFDRANPGYQFRQPIFRPGRELTAGSSATLTPPPDVLPGKLTFGPAIPESVLAERALDAAQQRLSTLESRSQKATARLDKIRVDQAARRARLSLFTAAEVRAEARLGKEIVTQPDVAVSGAGPAGRLFIGQQQGAPSVARPLAEGGVPVAPGQGMPALLRPDTQTVRYTDPALQQINEAEAARDISVEDRTRNIDIVVKSIDAANLRRRQNLPPGLPLQTTLDMPRPEGQLFIGSQYVPAGMKQPRAPGAQVEVQPGLLGDVPDTSEMWRSGMSEEIYDVVELANRLSRTQQNLDLTAAFKLLIQSELVIDPEELLGPETIRRFREEANLRAYSYEGGTPSVEGGIAAYAEGVPNRETKARLAEAQIFGRLLIDEMAKQGFVPVPITGSIGRGIGAADINQTTKFLPLYAKERLMAKTRVIEPNILDGYLRTAAGFTGAFKNLTLPFSIAWQIGDLVGIFVSAAVVGVNPGQLSNYMIESLRANYGGPDATRGQILRNVFRDAADRDVTPLGEALSASGLQDVGLRIGEQRRLRGFREEAEPMTRPQKLLREYTPNIRGDFNVGDIIPTWRKGMYRVNEAINRTGRHAFFLAQFQKVVDEFNAGNGTNYTAEQILETGLHRQPGPLREAFDNVVDSANDVMGDWMDLTPAERKYVLPNATFYAWIKHVHKLFLKVAKDHPASLKWTAYLGNFAYDPETDSFELYTDKIPLPGGFLAGSNWMNMFADVVGGPFGDLLVKGDPSGLLSPLSPLPRILGAAFLGQNLSRLRPVSRPYGTGQVSPTGAAQSPPLIRRPDELLGFSLQQFPIATRVMDLLPSGTIPGTNIQTGPYQRYDTGQARLRPGTPVKAPKVGGRAVAAGRLLGLPFLPTSSEEQLKDIERKAQQRLQAFETAKRRAEALSD